MNLSLHKTSSKLYNNKTFKFFHLIRNFTIRETTELQLKKNDLLETKELVKCIESARNAWINANNNFEFAKDEDMIDYYSYEIKACQVRYNYLIKQVKGKGLDMTAFNESLDK